MIRETTGVSVVLVNDETTLVIEQSIEDMGCLISGGRDDLGVKRRKLIGQVCVKLHTWVLTVMQVDEAADFALATGAKELSVGG